MPMLDLSRARGKGTAFPRLDGAARRH